MILIVFRICMVFLIGLVLLLLGFAHGYLGIALYRRLRLLKRWGVATLADVIDHRTSTLSRGWSTYYLTYRFHALQQDYSREQVVILGAHQQWKIGKRVSILYRPNAPDISMLNDDTQTWNGIVTNLIGA